MTLIQGCYTPYHPATRVSVGVSSPGARIGIYFSTYPDLVPIPGYPVYYAPGVNANYFFYDGLYWVFYGDNWYVSSWYNGPWDMVSYYDVPVFVLRIPVRYYRVPPPYFRGWRADAPPRWGEHWGREWEQRRSGWDHWDRSAVPAPAPLPTYQRNYSGDRYPREVEQQHTIRSEHYRYQPREPVAQQYFQRRMQQDQERERYQQGQPEQRRPQDRQREQYQERPLEQQRRQDQEREQYQQRRLKQQPPQDQQRERYQQHQPEQQRPQDPQREQYQQRRLEQQPPQDQQRWQEQQRSRPEPSGKAAPQERGQGDKDAERRKKGDAEWDQNR